MTPLYWRASHVVPCLILCAGEWVPLRLAEYLIGRRLYDGLWPSILYSACFVALCCVLLTAAANERR